jgi:hypothetical protein
MPGVLDDHMHLLSWVALAGVAGAVASWMMLACAMAGWMLWSTHQWTISTRWFKLVRRYGLWGAFRLLPRAVALRGIRGLWPGRDTVLTIVMVPLIGAAAACLLPIMVQILLIPESDQSGILGAWVDKTIAFDAVLGMFTAIYVWLMGISYMARPEIHRRGNLPQLTFPPNFTRAACDHLSLNIYWYSRISSGILFSTIYPWLYVIVVYTSSSDPSNGNAASSQNTPFVVSLFIFLALISPTLIPAWALARPIQRRMIATKASEEICLLLQSVTDAGGSQFHGLIADPFPYREDLANITQHLADVARQLDGRQLRGLAPHPISTLLRAVSWHIHEFLSNERSLRDCIPDDIREILTMTLGMFSAQYDWSSYHSLAQRISAFNMNGDPAVELIGKPRSRIASFASGMITGIPRIAIAITSLTAISAIIAAIILALLHRMNSNELLHYLR